MGVGYSPFGLVSHRNPQTSRKAPPDLSATRCASWTCQLITCNSSNRQRARGTHRTCLTSFPPFDERAFRFPRLRTAYSVLSPVCPVCPVCLVCRPCTVPYSFQTKLFDNKTATKAKRVTAFCRLAWLPCLLLCSGFLSTSARFSATAPPITRSRVCVRGLLFSLAVSFPRTVCSIRIAAVVACKDCVCAFAVVIHSLFSPSSPFCSLCCLKPGQLSLRCLVSYFSFVTRRCFRCIYIASRRTRFGGCGWLVRVELVGVDKVGKVASGSGREGGVVSFSFRRCAFPSLRGLSVLGQFFH